MDNAANEIFFQENQHKTDSLTIGTVKKNWDTLHPGMVVVSIKTETGKDMETDWIPVMSPYAANKCGFFMLPEIGSTVIIGYIDDNTASPVVIGSIWNTLGTDVGIPQNTANKNNSVKVFVTQSGHMIKFDESSEHPSVEIISGGKQSVLLDDKNGKLIVTSKACDSVIELDGKSGKVTVSAKDCISFSVSGRELLKLGKSGVEMTSDKVTINGKSLEIKGNQTKISGSSVEAKADGSLKLESSGMAQFKGSILKLN